MSGKEILEAYPHIPIAVAFVELFLSPSELDSYDVMGRIRGAGMCPAEAVAFIKGFCDEEMETLEGKLEAPKLKQARVQMDHPSFLTYIAGKMGAV